MAKIKRKAMNKIHNQMRRRFTPSWERQNARIVELERAVKELQAAQNKTPVRVPEKGKHVAEPSLPIVAKAERRTEVRLRRQDRKTSGHFVVNAWQMKVLTDVLDLEVLVIVHCTKNFEGEDAKIVRLAPKTIKTAYLPIFSVTVRRILGDDTIIETRPAQ